MARKMVCEWGMSDELGPLTYGLTYGKKEEQIFLGREIAQHRDFSEETARRIDLAVRRIIDAANATVEKLLAENKDILEKMAEELLEKETITLHDMEEIIEALRPGKYSDKISKRRRKAEEQKQEAARKREEELEAARRKADSEPVFTATEDNPQQDDKQPPQE